MAPIFHLFGQHTIKFGFPSSYSSFHHLGKAKNWDKLRDVLSKLEKADFHVKSWDDDGFVDKICDLYLNVNKVDRHGPTMLHNLVSEDGGDNSPLMKR